MQDERQRLIDRVGYEMATLSVEALRSLAAEATLRAAEEREQRAERETLAAPEERAA